MPREADGTKRRRRKAGLCPGCGDDPGRFVWCEPCRKRERERDRKRQPKRAASYAAWAAANRDAINARHRKWYADRTAKGKCGRCGNRARANGGCGVCAYIRRVRKRGGAFQGLKDGSCVGVTPCSATPTNST